MLPRFSARRQALASNVDSTTSGTDCRQGPNYSSNAEKFTEAKMKRRCMHCKKWFLLSHSQERASRTSLKKKNGNRFACSAKCQILWMNSKRLSTKRDTPEKLARHAVYRALKRGELKKPIRCSVCGKKPRFRIEAHHYAGYDRPLDVQWLCHPCHTTAHTIDGSRKGESNGRARLKDTDIPVIRNLLTVLTVARIAKKFNVGTSTISRIKNGHNWTHVS